LILGDTNVAGGIAAKGILLSRVRVPISMILAAAIAAEFHQRGLRFRAFVSPNLAAVDAQSNHQVFDEYVGKVDSRRRQPATSSPGATSKRT